MMKYTPFELKGSYLAGFDIIGYRQPDGSVLIGSKGEEQISMKEFPERIELLGNIYTLEDVRTEEGSNIEWGIYA